MLFWAGCELVMLKQTEQLFDSATEPQCYAFFLGGGGEIKINLQMAYL